jgi:hypothetical protein
MGSSRGLIWSSRGLIGSSRSLDRTGGQRRWRGIGGVRGGRGWGLGRGLPHGLLVERPGLERPPPQSAVWAVCLLAAWWGAGGGGGALWVSWALDAVWGAGGGGERGWRSWGREAARGGAAVRQKTLLPLRRRREQRRGTQPTRRSREGAPRPRSLHIQTVGGGYDEAPPRPRVNHPRRTTTRRGDALASPAFVCDLRAARRSGRRVAIKR